MNRTKFRKQDLATMRVLQKKGYSLREIASRFSVTYATIHWHLNPDHRKRKALYDKKWREGRKTI